MFIIVVIIIAQLREVPEGASVSKAPGDHDTTRALGPKVNKV